MSAPQTTAEDAPSRVRVSMHVLEVHRLWFKAAAATDGFKTVDEWLYTMAVRRAQELGVRMPNLRASN